MIKHIALLSFICFILSCQSNQRPKPNYAELVKGDWVGQVQPQGFEHDQTEFLSFEDSTCRFANRQDVLKYAVLKDTIYLFSDKEETPNKLTIVKLTPDSLILLSGKKQQNTIIYSRVRAKNNIAPSAIYFGSSGCSGNCPEIFIEIDSTRNIRFFGLRHTAITGGFKGKLSENEYNSIIAKIRNLPVDSLKDYYSASNTDDETLGVSIVHGDTVTRSSAYGHENEPMELHILFGKLMNLYKKVNMQPDTSVNEVYFFSNTNMSLKGVIPPPPPLMKEITAQDIIKIEAQKRQKIHNTTYHKRPG